MSTAPATSFAAPSYLAMVRGKRLNVILMACVATACLLLLSYHFNNFPGAATPPAVGNSRTNNKKPKYAYATFLSSRPDGDIEKDKYVIATRVLAYQLLHHPITRTTLGIPLLVLVPPHVPESVQRLLTSDGARVVQVENLNPRRWKPSPGISRWIDQFTKLRLFEQTEYDRILYMDNDMLVTRPLDGIWSEPQVQWEQQTKNQTDYKILKPDEAPLPSTYQVAGVGDQEGAEGERPKPITDGTRLNGGFFIFRPDVELFEYYKSVLEHGDEGRFDTGFMEMGLLNYAHRFEGNMPWTPLEPGKWSMNWPSYRDYEHGAATLHDKFWEEGNAGWIDRRLVEMWWRVQGQMEGFLQGQREAVFAKK